MVYEYSTLFERLRTFMPLFCYIGLNQCGWHYYRLWGAAQLLNEYNCGERTR